MFCNWRKLLSLLLCLVMVLSFFPVTALAEEGEDEGVVQEEEHDCGHDHEGGIGEAPDDTIGDDALDVPEDDEIDPDLVRVVFVCDPADTIITVYDPMNLDDDGEPLVVEPEEDGSYLLYPHEYIYSAEHDGYSSLVHEIQIEPAPSVISVRIELINKFTVIAPDSFTELPGDVQLDGLSASQIVQQIRDTYSNALSLSGRSSFNGYCGAYVSWQLASLGINTNYIGGNGNTQFDNYKNLTVTTGGYPVSAYPASSYSLNAALNSISQNGTADVYNILIGFEQGSGEAGRLYGHTCFIHAIIGGTVYFSESYAGTICGAYHTEGDPISCSIDAFCNYYGSWTVLDGVIHFGVSGGSGQKPIATLDSASGGAGVITVRGWAFDWDDVNASVPVHIYVGGPAGSGAGGYAIEANTEREDVNNVYGCGNNHGFDSTITVTERGTVTLYFYACDIESDLGNDQFATATVTITEPQAISYTVSYDANGGTGAPVAQTKTHDVALTLSTTTPTRAGYTFLGWATNATATIAQYQPGGSYTANADVTLYAVWAKNYTVSYNANGGTGAPGSQTKVSGQTLTLSTTRPTRPCHVFVGWATSASATTAQYQPGGSFTTNANTTLYAVWEEGTQSEWSTTKPTGVDESMIEEKTQYRYRDKVTTNTNQGNPSGWTLIGSHVEYGSWGSNQTTTTKPTESETLRIVDQYVSGYNYYHYCCNYYDGCYNVDSIPYGNTSSTHHHTTSTASALPACAIGDQGGKQAYGGSGTGAPGCSSGFYIWFLDSVTYTYVYQERTATTVYEYWTDWSDWSDTVYTASDNRQVETRKLYRYVQSGDVHQWDSGVVTTQPTCTTKGVMTYTCSKCGKTRTEEIAATGHSWGTPTYTWSTDNKAVTAKRVCANNSSHVETETANTTSQVTTAATCTTKGKTTYTATFTNSAFATQTKTVENIPATGHSWGAPTYTWSSDNKTVTAKRVCANNSSHVETETANTTSQVTTAATCTAKGKTTYTATFTNSAFATQTKTVENIPATGHSWGTPTYTWSSDNKTVTAKRVCANNSSHVETETANTTSQVTTAATCTTKGKTTYTATFTNSAFATQTKTVENIPATGHSWGTPTYTWSSDNNSVTAKRVCANNSSHVETETANTTSQVTTAATCTTKGKTTYTATFTNSAFATQTKTVENIPATGHSWGAPTYTWSSDNKTVTAKRVCANNSSHVETETANTTSQVTTAATCTTKGKTTYTATFTNSAFATQTKTVENIAALGHNWGKWEVTTPATVDQPGVETRTCSSCGATETRSYNAETVTVTYNANGGSVSPASVTILKDGTISSLPMPTRAGYTFKGWFTAASGGTEVTTATTFAADTTIYAQWTVITNAKLVVGSGRVIRGEEIQIPVRIEENPGVISIEISVHYDETVLEWTAVTAGEYGGTFLGEVGDTLTWYADDPRENETKDGVFVTLTFRAKDDAATGTTLVSVSYDEENVYNADEENQAFLTAPGEIEVIPYIPGDINGDGVVNNKDLTRLQRYLKGQNVEVQEAALDVNGDGKINNKDASRLQRYLRHGDVEIY